LKQVRSFVFVRSILIWVAHPRCTCRVDLLQIMSVTQERRIDYFKRKLLKESIAGDIHWRAGETTTLCARDASITFHYDKWQVISKKSAVAWCESNWKCVVIKRKLQRKRVFTLKQLCRHVLSGHYRNNMRKIL